MKNRNNFTDTHDKNRMDFHSFIKKVINKDTEQEDKESQPSE